MTNTKAQHSFTPGPWQYDDTNGLIRNAGNLNYRGIPICDMRTGESSEANACLIAAAPDSNAANIAALQYLCDENPRADRRHEVIAILEAAIAKAKKGDVV